MHQFEKSVPAGFEPTVTGGFRGYAARFLNIDRQGDMILPGAFSKSLPDFIDSGGLVLADHMNKTGAVIGTLIDAREDMSGLLVDVQFSATKSGQEVRQLMVEKALRKMSVQFYGKQVQYTEKQVSEVWATYGFVPTERQKAMARRGCKVISEVTEILEVSVVPIPANPEANILAVKGFDEENTSPKSVVSQIDFKALIERATIAERILGR